MSRFFVNNLGLTAIAIVGVMALAGWLFYENHLPVGPKVSDVAAARSMDARETVTLVGRPFPSAEQVASMAEARSRLAFDVKLPQLEGGWSPTVIWVSPDMEPEKFQQFQIHFSNGTRLSASRQEKEPRWQAVADGPLKLTLVEVEGHLEVRPESHWPGFALRQTDAL